MSSWSRPASDRATACQTTATAITAAASAHQYVTNTSLIPITIRVGRGSVCPRSARITAKRGSTKVSRKTTAAAPTTMRSTG